METTYPLLLYTRVPEQEQCVCMCTLTGTHTHTFQTHLHAHVHTHTHNTQTHTHTQAYTITHAHIYLHNLYFQLWLLFCCCFVCQCPVAFWNVTNTAVCVRAVCWTKSALSQRAQNFEGEMLGSHCPATCKCKAATSLFFFFFFVVVLLCWRDSAKNIWRIVRHQSPLPSHMHTYGHNSVS